jgi:hypothetical protein
MGGIMISFYRSACIAPGKTPSALAFAHEVAAYAKTLTGVDLKVGVPVGGNPSRVGWSSQYENLAAMEAAMAKLSGDAKYWEMVGRGADNFVAGSLHDEIWRSV